MTNEELVIRIKAGGDSAENMAQLWEQTRRYVYSIALRYQGQADIDDLMQEGYLSLYDAIEGYDPAAGFLFLTYAGHKIRQRMARYIQNNGTVRLPVHEWEKIGRYKKLVNSFILNTGRRPSELEICRYMGLSLKQSRELVKAVEMAQIGSLDSLVSEEGESTIGDMVPGYDDVEAAVLDEVQAGQLQAALWDTVDTLPGDQPAVIRGRYQAGRTLREVGAAMGVTIERVRQIEGKALRELRRPGPRQRLLRAFLPEESESQAYRHNGVEEFNRTWTSSTERIAMRL